MNHTRRWLAKVRPRHNPAENALIANMRDDPNIPWLNSLAASRPSGEWTDDDYDVLADSVMVGRAVAVDARLWAL